jgi:hypothetical protein
MARRLVNGIREPSVDAVSPAALRLAILDPAYLRATGPGAVAPVSFRVRNSQENPDWLVSEEQV